MSQKRWMPERAAIAESWCCATAAFWVAARFFYLVGSYSCSGERWKGELTQQEHTPAPLTFATARRIVTAGFTGTYTDEGAEFEATALVGKRSLRYHAIMRLLTADGPERPTP